MTKQDLFDYLRFLDEYIENVDDIIKISYPISNKIKVKYKLANGINIVDFLDVSEIHNYLNSVMQQKIKSLYE